MTGGRSLEAGGRGGKFLPPIFLAVVFVLVALLGGPGPVWADTVQYIRIARELSGMSADQAWFEAFSEFCQNPSISFSGTVAHCISSTYAGHGPVIGLNDRILPYAAIFTPRIGYPLISLPLMNLWGDRIGLWIIAVVATMVAGLLVYAIARVCGLGRLASVIAQLAFYVLPAGFGHGTALLAEGPSLVGVLVLVLGFAYVLRHRLRLGLLLMLLGFALVYFFKYSSVMIICVATVVVCVGALFTRLHRRSVTIWIAGITAGILTIISLIISALAGFPSVEDSLQDTFTRHFLEPLVSDPWQRLIALEGDFLGNLVANLLSNWGWLLVACAGIIGLAMLWRRGHSQPLFLALLVPGVFGLLTVVGHPVFSQSARLGSPVWVSVAFGVAVTIAWLVGRVKHLKPVSSRLQNRASPRAVSAPPSPTDQQQSTS